MSYSSKLLLLAKNISMHYCYHYNITLTISLRNKHQSKSLLLTNSSLKLVKILFHPEYTLLLSSRCVRNNRSLVTIAVESILLKKTLSPRSHKTTSSTRTIITFEAFQVKTKNNFSRKTCFFDRLTNSSMIKFHFKKYVALKISPEVAHSL